MGCDWRSVTATVTPWPSAHDMCVLLMIGRRVTCAEKKSVPRVVEVAWASGQQQPAAVEQAWRVRARVCVGVVGVSSAQGPAGGVVGSQQQQQSRARASCVLQLSSAGKQQRAACARRLLAAPQM